MITFRAVTCGILLYLLAIVVAEYVCRTILGVPPYSGPVVFGVSFCEGVFAVTCAALTAGYVARHYGWIFGFMMGVWGIVAVDVALAIIVGPPYFRYWPGILKHPAILLEFASLLGIGTLCGALGQKVRRKV